MKKAPSEAEAAVKHELREAVLNICAKLKGRYNVEAAWVVDQLLFEAMTYAKVNGGKRDQMQWRFESALAAVWRTPEKP